LEQFDPQPLTPTGPGDPKAVKAEGHIFENCLQNKRCSAGCKLTRAVSYCTKITQGDVESCRQVGLLFILFAFRLFASN